MASSTWQTLRRSDGRSVPCSWIGLRSLRRRMGPNGTLVLSVAVEVRAEVILRIRAEDRERSHLKSMIRPIPLSVGEPPAVQLPHQLKPSPMAPGHLHKSMRKLKRLCFERVLEDLKLLSKPKLYKNEWRRARIALKTAAAARSESASQKRCPLQ